MIITSQPYPLWLAQVIDDEIQAGRIIAWSISEPGTGSPDAIAHPIVVFADDDGFVWATMQASRTATRFVCDAREASVEAAEKWVLAHERDPRNAGSIGSGRANRNHVA